MSRSADARRRTWRRTIGPTSPRSSGGKGVVVDARELKRLPHDVVLSERLLARVARDDLSP